MEGQLSLFDLFPETETRFEKSEEQKEFDNIIKNEILKGSGFKNGKKRILKWFQNETEEELTKLLRKEYGDGGWTILWKGKVIGFHQHGASGIDINFYEHIGKTHGLHIGWPMLVKDIRKYINSGEYTENSVSIADNGNVAPCPHVEKCSTYGIGCQGKTYWCGRYKKG